MPRRPRQPPGGVRRSAGQRRLAVALATVTTVATVLVKSWPG